MYICLQNLNYLTQHQQPQPQQQNAKSQIKEEVIVEFDEKLKDALEQKLKSETDVDTMIEWITVIIRN
jgi:hypothetical protein